LARKGGTVSLCSGIETGRKTGEREADRLNVSEPPATLVVREVDEYRQAPEAQVLIS
jgi:hypothetical protein